MSATAKTPKHQEEKRKLPDGWRWGKLGNVCEIIAGQSPPGSTYRTTSGGLPFFQGKADFGKTNPVARVWCVEPTKVAQSGDILISIRAPVGPTNVADVECCIGRGLAAIRCGKNADRDFILNTLRHFETTLVRKGSGSTFEAINRDVLDSFEIPLPPLAEQRRIARVLRKQMAAVEKARAAAHARLAAVKDLSAALLRQVFPQPDQPLPDGWRWVRLGEVCKVVGGSTPGTGTPDYWDGKIVWVTPTDLGRLFDMTITTAGRRITAAGLQSCGTEMLPVGTVIMSSRAPIGHLAIAGVSLCTNQGCKSFVPNVNVDSVFLYWTLKQSMPEIRRFGSGATFAEVSKSALKQFKVLLPSLVEQRRIAAALRKQMAAVEKARASAEAELETINTLPAALLRRAFNGEI